MDIRIRRGLDINVPGAPRQKIGDSPRLTTVALQGGDYPDIRPKLSVALGDRVRLGQTLFVDRHRPRMAFTAPSSGTVTAIERGARRSLTSLVIEADESDPVQFERLRGTPDREQARQALLMSGLWPALIARPFGRIPDPDTTPAAIFVTAMDTNPLATDAFVVLEEFTEAFQNGLHIIQVLTDGPVYICQAPGKSLVGDLGQPFESATFRGPHPAGLPGTHIHHLAATGGGRVVWHINYQDVIAVGKLWATGRVWADRIISVAGPGVRQPCLMQTRIGADIDEVLAGKLTGSDLRIISGSVLSGRAARYLGRYHQQISVLREGKSAPGGGLLSWLRSRPDSTSLNGRAGSLIPSAALDGVMPLRILTVPLLRALSVGDVETAHKLGCMELVEEDIALLSHVCASKTDYGPLLRQALDGVQGEGT